MEYLPTETSDKLGSGTYGKVYKVVGPDNKEYAVKVPSLDDDDPNSIWIYETFVTEGSILSLLSGLDGIVKTEAVSYQPPLIALDLYQMDGIKFGQYLLDLLETGAVSIGDLDDTEKLHPNVIELLNRVYKLKKRFMYSALVGLDNQFSWGIIHRDVKPQNMLGDITGKFVISDYGLSESELYPAAEKSLEVYSSYFRPPEVWMGDKLYDLSADMWALGISYYYISTGIATKKLGDIVRLVGIDSYKDYFVNYFVANSGISNKEFMMTVKDKFSDYKKLNVQLGQLDPRNAGSEVISKLAEGQYLTLLEDEYPNVRLSDIYRFVRWMITFLQTYRSSLISRALSLQECVRYKRLTKAEASLLKYMLRFDSDERLSPKELYMQHPYFDSLRDSKDLPYPDDNLRKRIPSRISHRVGGRMDSIYARVTFDNYMNLDKSLNRSCLSSDSSEYMTNIVDYLTITRQYTNMSDDIATTFLYLAPFTCIEHYTDIELEALLFLASIIVSGESVLSDDNPIPEQLYDAVQFISSKLQIPRFMNVILLFNYRCIERFNRLPDSDEYEDLLEFLSAGYHIRRSLVSIFDDCIIDIDIPSAAMK